MGAVAKTLSGAMAALLLLIALAPPARADAAGPTDYRSEILEIKPANDAIKVEIIGGDAFMSLEQLQRVEVIVLGYQSEPYLRFDPDGTVYENRRSPAVWQNEDRFGTEDELPTYVDAKAPPEWTQVATGGSYVWHDHRSHWMLIEKPPGSMAGDQISEGVVLLQVDGTDVDISVAVFLLAPPSKLPVLGGVGLGLLAAALTWNKPRPARSLLGLLSAGAAALVGAAAFSSVPGVTAPSQLLWLLPAIAGACLLVQILVRNRTATTVYLDGLAVAAGTTLAAWAVSRIDALTRSFIPTTTPEALDRFVIAFALVTGLLVAITGLVGLLRPQRLSPIEATT